MKSLADFSSASVLVITCTCVEQLELPNTVCPRYIGIAGLICSMREETGTLQYEVKVTAERLAMNVVAR